MTSFDSAAFDTSSFSTSAFDLQAGTAGVEYTYSLDTILKDTLPHLPGAQRDVALRELRLAIREFFEQSYAWTEVIRDTPLSTGDTEHQISAIGKIGVNNNDATVLTVLDVAVGTDAQGYNRLKPMGSRPLRLESSGGWPYGWYTVSNADTIKFHPYYTGPDSLKIRALVALMPPIDAAAVGAEFPRQFELKWYQAIVNGFLARMYMHPSEPYSDPVIGAKLRTRFRYQIGYYAARRKQGYNHSPMWRFPGGWNPRTGGF